MSEEENSKKLHNSNQSGKLDKVVNFTSSNNIQKTMPNFQEHKKVMMGKTIEKSLK